ncbi:protein FAM13B-like isoform X1 [Chiloscyllium plagiosum]|uniref:protein FAM13B-like isoform X1 n=1 Tax=Chiloscyllium plagiosum TaxID=36176 RepID=UPI001CB86A0F|nr:protein FAM13B-like isoform X1 [Chiloscyllium plagiosum]
MRKSFSPSPSNSNSSTTNKFFGVPLHELQQQGHHPGNGSRFIVKHIVEYLEAYGNIEDELGRKLKCFLDELPAVNYNLLKFLCQYLVKVALQKEEKWTSRNLAAVFDLDVFHICTDVEDMKEQETASNIMSELLENYSDFFGTEEFLPTNISNSFCVEVTESCEEGDKIEQTALPEKSERILMNAEHLTIMKNTNESDIVLSASAHGSSIDQLTISVEENLTEENNHNSEVNKSALSEALQHADSLEENDQKLSLHNCTLEALKIHLHQDVENVVENLSLPDVPLLNVPEENLDNEPIIDEENNNKTERPESTSVSEIDVGSSFMLTLNSSAEIYDLNANKKSDVPKSKEVSNQDNRVRPEIAHLDLKRVTETGDWEAPCTITFPFIDFKTMHLQRDGNDPVPAFKSWQDEYEHELGEAQLSPQAGRLISHPLEEDPPPMLCRRYLNFGHSQRFIHESDSKTSSLKGLSSFRPRRSSFDSNDEKEEHAQLQLTKKVQNIKKKIKLFEEQFEKERKYKPSHSDKVANPKVLKWMNELVKLRKQLKEVKYKTSENDLEVLPVIRPRSNTLPKSFGSCLEHEQRDESKETLEKEKKPSKEATLETILKRLKEKRAEEDWPEDIKEMRQNHLTAEKIALQKSLLYFESIHGHPVTREEKQLVKPLYDRYRLVKQMLAKASATPVIGSPSTKRRGQTLQPIIEGETAHFFEEVKEEEEDEDDCNVTADFTLTLRPDLHARNFLDQLDNDHNTIASTVKETSVRLSLDLGVSSMHAASMPELLEQLWKARDDRKKLRKTLREFEEKFYKKNGRNVQKEDRTPMIEEYREYKRIKARVRLLEVLISKQDTAKSL